MDQANTDESHKNTLKVAGEIYAELSNIDLIDFSLEQIDFFVCAASFNAQFQSLILNKVLLNMFARRSETQLVNRLVKATAGFVKEQTVEARSLSLKEVCDVILTIRNSERTRYMEQQIGVDLTGMTDDNVTDYLEKIKTGYKATYGEELSMKVNTKK